MKRKVNLVGQNTLTVSLPTKWAKDNKIQKGDEVQVIESDNSVLISAPENRHDTEKLLSIKVSKEDFSMRYITVPYVRGYNFIRIIFDKIAILERIEETLRLTPGFEIVSQDKEHVDIKFIFGNVTQEFDNIFERLYNVIYAGLEELSDELKSGSYDNSIFLSKMSLDSDKYELYCRRILSVNGYKYPQKKNSVYMIIRNYESIGDIFKIISKQVSEKKIKKSSELSDYCSTLMEFLKLIHKTFYSGKEHSSVTDIKKFIGRMDKEFISLNECISSKDHLIISGYLFHITRQLVHIAEESLFMDSE